MSYELTCTDCGAESEGSYNPSVHPQTYLMDQTDCDCDAPVEANSQNGGPVKVLR